MLRLCIYLHMPRALGCIDHENDAVPQRDAADLFERRLCPVTFEAAVTTMSFVSGRIACLIAAGDMRPCLSPRTMLTSTPFFSRLCSGRITELCSIDVVTT